ncbi:hypothetical protein GCK72_022300 [Caenorhabditis remanei]|uniref:Uncharacterized protein n=1 Tax=Caenorhabditis remanei TaxID=31234 RepID=A0A6A5FTH9_CAERE|nr:hypothetical protein GCK72_022300 [Caenorhabditis remanei]KAF1745853.1 hypothetical protein GCK72_022300 [Caenorhabditis remanei]
MDAQGEFCIILSNEKPNRIWSKEGEWECDVDYGTNHGFGQCKLELMKCFNKGSKTMKFFLCPKEQAPWKLWGAYEMSEVRFDKSSNVAKNHCPEIRYFKDVHLGWIKMKWKDCRHFTDRVGMWVMKLDEPENVPGEHLKCHWVVTDTESLDDNGWITEEEEVEEEEEEDDVESDSEGYYSTASSQFSRASSPEVLRPPSPLLDLGLSDEIHDLPQYRPVSHSTDTAPLIIPLLSTTPAIMPSAVQDEERIHTNVAGIIFKTSNKKLSNTDYDVSNGRYELDVDDYTYYIFTRFAVIKLDCPEFAQYRVDGMIVYCDISLDRDRNIFIVTQFHSATSFTEGEASMDQDVYVEESPTGSLIAYCYLDLESEAVCESLNGDFRQYEHPILGIVEVLDDIYLYPDMHSGRLVLENDEPEKLIQGIRYWCCQEDLLGDGVFRERALSESSRSRGETTTDEDDSEDEEDLERNRRLEQRRAETTDQEKLENGSDPEKNHDNDQLLEHYLDHKLKMARRYIYDDIMTFGIIVALQGDNENGLFGKVMTTKGPNFVNGLKLEEESPTYEVGDWIKIKTKKNCHEVLEITGFARSFWVSTTTMDNGLTIRGDIHIAAYTLCKKENEYTYYKDRDVGRIPIENKYLEGDVESVHIELKYRTEPKPSYGKNVSYWDVIRIFGNTMRDRGAEEEKRFNNPWLTELDESDSVSKEHLAIAMQHFENNKILVWIREMKVAAILDRNMARGEEILLGCIFICTLDEATKTKSFNMINGIYFEVATIVEMLDLRANTRPISDHEVEILLTVDSNNIHEMRDITIGYSNSKDVICFTPESANHFLNNSRENPKKEVWCRLKPQRMARQFVVEDIQNLYTRQIYVCQVWTIVDPYA